MTYDHCEHISATPRELREELSRRLRPADIIGTTEVLELAGIRTRHTLNAWRVDQGFPEPFKTVAGTALYDRRAVEKWLREHR